MNHSELTKNISRSAAETVNQRLIRSSSQTRDFKMYSQLPCFKHNLRDTVRGEQVGKLQFDVNRKVPSLSHGQGNLVKEDHKIRLLPTTKL